jgi:hypothetical protein
MFFIFQWNHERVLGAMLEAPSAEEEVAQENILQTLNQDQPQRVSEVVSMVADCLG